MRIFNPAIHLFILTASTALLIAESSPTSEAATSTSTPEQLSPPKYVTEIQFIPPKGWQYADPASLPKSVKTMVVGKGTREFPPSINLGVESYSGTLRDYLKRIKEINQSKGVEWKDLGTIKTKAGVASLSQVETKTQWGDVKMMHVILMKNNMVYIVTAASAKEDFPKFYKDFFAAFKSISFANKQL